MTRSRASAKQAGTKFETAIARALAAALDDDRIERRARGGAKPKNGSELVECGEAARCSNTSRPLTHRIRPNRMEGSVEPIAKSSRACLWCGETFADRPGRGGRQTTRKYCTEKCKAYARRQANRNPTPYTCSGCGDVRILLHPPTSDRCVKCAASLGSLAAAAKPRVSAKERFDNKWLRSSNGCWVWQASRRRNGYGQFYLNGREIEAHRAAYILYVGDIPQGLHIDHLCRNKICVNPEHLEPVTPRENTLRGVANPAVNAAKTHCINGHEFTPDNTYTRPGPRGLPKRYCRECRRRRVREHQARKAVGN